MSGRLVYIMGPSGCGKDALLGGAQSLPRMPGRVFARRYITRAPGVTGEQHIAVTEEHFRELETAGEFCMTWQSHGLSYGIPASICRTIAAGCIVLVNGSREYLPEALRRFPDLLPVLIEVPCEELERRLKLRAREHGDALTERLKGAALKQDYPPQTARLDNSGELQRSIRQLMALVNRAG